jgi:hypothetical protein
MPVNSNIRAIPFACMLSFDPSIWMMPAVQENDDNKERKLQNDTFQ